jgi:hypothetical protein
MKRVTMIRDYMRSAHTYYCLLKIGYTIHPTFYKSQRKFGSIANQATMEHDAFLTDLLFNMEIGWPTFSSMILLPPHHTVKRS